MHSLAVIIFLVVLGSVQVLGSLPEHGSNVRTPRAESLTGRSGIRTSNSGGNRRDHNCYYNQRRYRHNEMFSRPGSSRCIRYLCWYGQVHLREEGCDFGGECRPIGSTFESECMTYRCQKSRHAGYHLYRTVFVSSRCRDYYGHCHSLGNTFSFAINGRFSDDCTCSQRGTGIYYSCQYTYNINRPHH